MGNGNFIGEEGGSQNHRRLVKLLLVMVLLGAVLRVSQYFSRRSFWHDESSVIVNLQSRTAAELFGPLTDPASAPVAAPVGFLLIEKFAAQTLGYGELSLRLYGQVLALLALPVFARVAWVMIGPRGAVLAMFLFAACPQLIEHSAEVKPYSGDVFFACLIWWVAIEPKLTRDDSAALLRAALVAGMGIWFSYSVGFVFGGVSLALLPRMFRSARGRVRFVLLNALVAASVFVEYFVCIRHQHYPVLMDAWADRFVDWGNPGHVPIWLVDSIGQSFAFAADKAGAVVAILVLVALVVRSRFTEARWMGMFLIPIGLDLAAAGVGAFPFGGTRATLFQIVPILLVAGGGFETLVESPRVWWRRAGWVLGVACFVILMIPDGYHLVVPRSKAHVRPAMEYMQAHRESGDRIYVVGGETSLNYFAYSGHRVDEETTLNFYPYQPLVGKRMWLIFGGAPERLEEEMKPMLEAARGVAKEKDSFEVRGGAAYLFERDGER